MRKIIALIAAAGILVAIPATAGATTHRTYALHAKHCRVGYAKKTMRHKVHGKSVRYVACVYKTKTVTTQTGSSTSVTTTTSTGTKTTTYHVKLDPGFSQSPTNPRDVTWDFSASEQVQTNSAAPVQVSLDSGVLDFYLNGSLKCSTNVGGAVSSSECEVNPTPIGTNTTVVEYVSGSSTTSDTEQYNVSLFSSSMMEGSSYTTGQGFVGADHNYAVTVHIPVTVVGSGVTPTGTVSMAGGSCSALTGGTAECTTQVENQQSVSQYSGQVNYSGDGNFSPSGSAVSANVPAAPPPSVDNETTTVQSVNYGPVGGDHFANAKISPEPSAEGPDQGTVTFTDNNGQTLCVASNGSSGTFQCTFSQTFTAPVHAAYSGTTIDQGDSSVTNYSASSL